MQKILCIKKSTSLFEATKNFLQKDNDSKILSLLNIVSSVLQYELQHLL